MIEYKSAQFSDILEDAKTNGRASELKEYGLATVEATKKDGTTYQRQKTFFEIKKWYYAKYYPDLLPASKSKKPTMFDLLNEL